MERGEEQLRFPLAAELFSRLDVPGAVPRRKPGDSPAERQENAVLEDAGSFAPDPKDRLEAAETLLKRLAAAEQDVDEAEVDRMIRDAEEALRKLNGEGEQAVLSASEAFALEAVIETDGSRPVLFVQDGTIDLRAPELQGSFAACWLGAAATFRTGIERVVGAVGAVQLPAFKDRRGIPRRIGTAFAIAPGLVLTNRHVLELVARWYDDRWNWIYDVEIDFAGEYERPRECRFKVADVQLTGPDAISGTVNFAHLDLAVLRLAEGGMAFPEPLPLESDPERVTVGAVRPQIYTVGFPAKPNVDRAVPDNPIPAAGHEYEEVLEKLYRNRFGSKRWAPGYVKAGPGQMAADTRNWAMSHDSSTLSGNSGSCVVDFTDTGERVVGLHFGGRARVENYAHVVAALQQELAGSAGLSWARSYHGS